MDTLYRVKYCGMRFACASTTLTTISIKQLSRFGRALTYVFDKTPIVKLLCSMQYRYARHVKFKS